MAVQPLRRVFTVDEYERMGNAGIFAPDERVELIDGEVIAMPPIGRPHALCVSRSMWLLVSRLGSRAQVETQNPIHLSDLSEPVPDLMVLRPSPDHYAGGHPTAADVMLLIEVSDTTLAYDQRTKLPVYARESIPEVWIADLVHRVIHVYRDPRPEGYRTTLTFGLGGRLAPLAFPDVDLSVEEILG
jgi:Uma2 family endonuclease